MSNRQVTLEDAIERFLNLQGAAVRFRGELRDARLAADKNAEGFQEIIFAIERLGRACCPTAKGLGQLKVPLSTLAKRASSLDGLSRPGVAGSAWFGVLYELVQEGRNDALHQGAVARNLTRHAVELALVLEDALMPTNRVVRDFMAGNPLCAAPWESLASVRRTMLANAFSFLPLSLDDKWFFLSDYDLARFLSCGDRKNTLACRLDAAVRDKHLHCMEARQCIENERVEDVLKTAEAQPVLVFDESRLRLVGILTAYDVL